MMPALRLCAILALLIARCSATTPLLIASPPQLECEGEARTQCRVWFTFENQDFDFLLFREEGSVFNAQSLLVDQDGIESPLVLNHVLYSSSRPEMQQPVPASGATMALGERGDILYAAFFTRAFGMLEFDPNASSSSNAEVFANQRQLSENSEPGYEFGTIIPFFPGCYAGDEETHLLTMTLIVDFSAANQASALTKVNVQMTPVKSLFLQQFNINLTVRKTIFGKKTDANPLKRAARDCTSAIATLKELGAWLKPRPQKNAFTLLLSNCFPRGETNDASLCRTNAFGVAQLNTRAILRELGRALGMEDDVVHGGAMNWTVPGESSSTGEFNGALQYNPYGSKEQACALLDGLRGNCPYFTTRLEPESTCGDGFLGLDEECECVNRAKACGICRNCRITSKKKIQCSSSKFVYRGAATPSTLFLATSAQLDNAQCCPRGNRFAKPKTKCNTAAAGGRMQGACGPNGKCVPVCSLHHPNTKSCAFDASGCNLGCGTQARECRFDLLSEGIPVSQLPDGTACITSPSAGGGRSAPVQGKCQNGQCFAE